MSLHREPGQVVVKIKTGHLQAALVILLGALGGLVLFFVVKPFTPDLASLSSSDSAEDSVSWFEAPRFDVEVEGRPSMGTPGAPVTIVEFTDYGCPYCRRHALEVLPVLLDTVDANVNYVVRHFPIPALTPGGLNAAVAAECAFRQGSFWEYKGALQDELESFQEVRLRAQAAAVGLDEDEFVECSGEEEVREKVERDILDAWEYGVTGTPTFFINGKRFQGARPLEELLEYVRLALRESESN